MQFRTFTLIAIPFAYLMLAGWAQSRAHCYTDFIGLGREAITYEYGWPIQTAQRRVLSTYDRNAWQYGGPENRRVQSDETVIEKFGLVVNIFFNLAVSILLAISIASAMQMKLRISQYSIANLLSGILGIAIAITLLNLAEYPHWKTSDSLALTVQWIVGVASISIGTALCFNRLVTKRMGKSAG